MELVPPKVQKIIVAPLNWGLGHATRSIPIIRKLLAQKKEVILASDGEALELLQAEFPDLDSATLPSYKVRYDYSSLPMIVLSNSQNISSAIRRERKKCRTLVEEHQADMVISDSRFGFRCDTVPSVIITHQLNPLSSNPVLKWFLERGNRYYLNKFDECWVPDDAEHSLSGILSQNSKINKVRYLGPLSRLDKSLANNSDKYDLTIVLSGPEPARSRLEAELVETINTSDKRICLIRGTKAAKSIVLPDYWTTYNLASSQEMNILMVIGVLDISKMLQN